MEPTKSQSRWGLLLTIFTVMLPVAAIFLLLAAIVSGVREWHKTELVVRTEMSTLVVSTRRLARMVPLKFACVMDCATRGKAVSSSVRNSFLVASEEGGSLFTTTVLKPTQARICSEQQYGTKDRRSQPSSSTDPRKWSNKPAPWLSRGLFFSILKGD